MKPWEGILKIPEGHVNDYAIKHIAIKAGDKVPMGSLRNKVIGGQKAPQYITFDHDTTWHKLVYDGGVWMTDYPIEQKQIDNLLKPVKSGRVLVGGLGLGYAATILAKRKNVQSVVVIEKSKEVIELVCDHIIKRLPLDQSRKLTVLCLDLFDFLSDIKERDGSGFGWAFYDIWQHDGEDTFHNMVVPLRMLSEGIVWDDQVICWQETLMRNQLLLGLFGHISIMVVPAFREKSGITIEQLLEPEPEDKPGAIYKNWCIPFFQTCQDLSLSHSNMEAAARAYVWIYGRPGWKVKWEEFSRRSL